MSSCGGALTVEKPGAGAASGGSWSSFFLDSDSFGGGRSGSGAGLLEGSTSEGGPLAGAEGQSPSGSGVVGLGLFFDLVACFVFFGDHDFEGSNILRLLDDLQSGQIY